jgi:uncharacterized membrane protein YfhO
MAKSEVDLLDYQPHHIQMRVNMDRRGYVVLSDTWYPGWRAFLDGQPVPIERANLSFRAVQVPQGQHDLQLAYKPASYAWGTRLSLGTLLVVALGLVLAVRKALLNQDHIQPQHD